MTDQSMRGFLDLVSQEFPDDMLVIEDPVKTHLDITSTVIELDRRGLAPVVRFDNVEGHDMPVVTNLAANRKLLAATLDCPTDALPATFRQRCQNYLPVDVRGDAPWQAVCLEKDDVDLAKLPIPFHFAVDAAPYITAGQICARDPETGVDTTGFHRLMVNGRNRLGVSLHSRRRMYSFHKKAEERGENLPAVITLGVHPIHYMGSMAYHYPPQVRKYEVIGALFGDSYRVARCRTADLEVPFGAEIVIEGEILAGVHEPEGPFGEFTGYASFRSTQNVFEVSRIQMREAPIFHSIASGMSADHILISCVSREAEIMNTLRRNLPNVTAVHVPHVTAGALLAVVQMKNPVKGEPHQAIMAALGTEYYCKCVVVVDEDVDIFDLSDVMWAVITRTRANTDIIRIDGAKGAILDPTSDPDDNTVTKIGIDATKPPGVDFAQRLYVPDEQAARVAEILSRAGIGGRQALK